MVLDDRLGPEVSLAVALALRLVTTCGDVIFFALAMILRLQPPPRASHRPRPIRLKKTRIFSAAAPRGRPDLAGRHR